MRPVPIHASLASFGGFVLVAGLAVGSCSDSPRPAPAQARSASHPSILLVTLDTTRADSIGPEAVGVATPAFSALAERGRRFRRAYTAVPETLPSHTSLMTGLYPAGHGVHENGRSLAAGQAVLAEQLQKAGYRTEAFVSAFVLARRFGLARGFDLYDDEIPAAGSERNAAQTTARAIASFRSPARQPLFLWVHYFDPHAPYAPPEPFRKSAKTAYLGEVEAMDQQLGLLIGAFEGQVQGPTAIVVVGDHGEGLGDHGESQHGNLLYEATMRVPLVLVGPGVRTGVSETPVSIRRVFHTIRDWAGIGADHSLLGPEAELVLGEAMKPFLAYGWQPQVMAVEGRQKAILAGRLEAYDVVADPAEARELGESAGVPRTVRAALLEYPVPSLTGVPAREALSEDERRKLASLGYVSAGAAPLVRKDAPRPVDRVRLFDLLEEASGLFVREEYARVIPLLERILAEDPGNLDAALRLATAHSSLGHEQRAEATFERAAGMAPESPDVRTYLALHYARGRRWERAVPLLERVVAETPDRLPALEALAVIRERQGRIEEAIGLRQRIYALRGPTPAEEVQLGQLAMNTGNTTLAIAAFETARARLGKSFANDLELGVLYLATRRFGEARDCLDRVPPEHPGYPMALFKRAQVSVLLGEPDQAARVAAARGHANSETRALIERERLFRSPRTP